MFTQKSNLFSILCCIAVLCFWNCDIADSGGAGSTFAVVSNPSGHPEGPEDIAVDNDYVYILGGDNSLCGAQWDTQWRIEKRTIATGALVAAFDADGILLFNPTNNEDIATSLAVDSTYIYAAGMNDGSTVGCIIKVNKTTGAFDNGFGNNGVLEYGGEQAHFLVGDDSSLYVIDHNLGAIRIIKLNKTTGAFDNGFSTNGVLTMDALELAVDNDYLYVVRTNLTKLNKATGEIIDAFGTNGVVDTLGIVNTIAIDSDYIYIATSNPFPGSWFVEKFDIDSGAPAAGFDTDGGSTLTSGIVMSITVDAGYIYLGGTDRNPPINDWQWCIEKRDILTGNLVMAFATNGVSVSNPSNGDDALFSHVIDSSFIYSIGIDDNSGDSQWRLEKRNKSTGDL